MGLDTKNCLWGFANNTGADQPAHRRSLISAFVIRFFESIICKLATGKIPIFWILSVAEETGLKLTVAETLKTGFLAMRPKSQRNKRITRMLPVVPPMC